MDVQLSSVFLLSVIALILGGLYHVLTRCALALEKLADIAKLRSRYYEHFK